tara:strand:- start:7116 stop:8198 length:1083 start_codon:yes stop_codon:yes gene_type:complete
MSVSSNNLYNFVAQALENKFLVKYFYPWGAKGFENIIDNDEDSIPTTLTYNKNRVPVILCHDQEPLHFDLYNDDYLLEQLDHISQNWLLRPCLDQGVKNLNLRWIQPDHKANYWVLLHSELNSPQVTQYESTGLFKCAYWWSHAVIAIDWYRFARYDNRLADKSQPIKANFLVYARGTTGKRAYRKLFLEHLQHIDSVQLGSIDSTAVVTSDSSATYNPQDFAQTRCSIVLETVYDQRIHLTEKTLRPIACGHPFMILNGPGALETIRSYGFKTFQPYIDESYDSEQDPEKRMDKVLAEMHRINNSSDKYQKFIWEGCAEIAAYNKQLFFDDKFLCLLKTELTRNVHTIQQHTQYTPPAV